MTNLLKTLKGGVRTAEPNLSGPGVKQATRGDLEEV